MAKAGKRIRSIREGIEPGKAYGIDEALELLKNSSKVKFKESVDVAVRLGVDPRKSDQNVRGSTVLPNGTGKTVRVAVFAQSENAEKAKEAGADIVNDVGGFRHAGRRQRGLRPGQSTIVGPAQEVPEQVGPVLDVGVQYVSGIYEVAVEDGPVCLGVSEWID